MTTTNHQSTDSKRKEPIRNKLYNLAFRLGVRLYPTHTHCKYYSSCVNERGVAPEGMCWDCSNHPFSGPIVFTCALLGGLVVSLLIILVAKAVIPQGA